MKKLNILLAAVAIGGVLTGQAAAQNVGTNAGIWWNPAPGQPAAFTFLNPLTTVYGRIGFLRSFNDEQRLHLGGLPTLGLLVPDAWGGVIGIGARLMPVLRYELQLGGMFSTHARLTNGFVPLVGDSVRLASTQLLNNFYIDVAPFFANNLWGLNPYGFAGVGVAWNTTGDLIILTVTRPGSGATRTQFAWNAGVGVQWQAMRGVILDVSYRYLDVGRFTVNQGSGLIAGGSTSRMASHQFMFSVVVPIDGLIRGFGN